MKQINLKKQVMSALLGLGLFGVFASGVVFAEDTAVPPTGTEISADATQPYKEVRISNDVTGVKGMILSIGIRRASDGKWFDVPVNKDISTGELPGVATIEQLHLTEGKYDKIRVGHEPLQAKGSITVTDKDGNQSIYGSMPRKGNQVLKFKKDQAPEFFELSVPATQTENSEAYMSNFNKWGVGSFVDNNVEYDTSWEDLEIVKDADGKLVVKNNEPLVFLLRPNYIWAGAGVTGAKAEKIPGLYDYDFDDTYVTAKIEKLSYNVTMPENQDPDHIEYAYKINNVLNNSPNKDEQITDDTYFFNEDLSIVQVPRVDPIEVVGSKDELAKYLLAKMKQEQLAGQASVVAEKTSDEVVYRQRVI